MLQRVLGAVVLLIAIALDAQSQTPPFSISGTVTDVNGAAIPTAQVTVVSQTTGATRSSQTDVAGRYKIDSLPGGKAAVTVEADGFSKLERTIDIQSDQNAVDLQLSVGTVSVDLTVEADNVQLQFERVPGATALVGRDQIQQTLGSNLSDVLGFIPGVFARSRYGSDETQFSVRGSGLRNNFHARGINILINGLPYGDADGASDYETLEFLTAKRVELWKAANALRYGGNSAGGALNLVTETGDTAFPLEIRLQGGSFDSFKGYISSGGKYGKFGYFVGVSDTEFGGYRDHSVQGRRRLFTNFGYDLDPNTDLYGDFVFANIGEKLPGALTYAEFQTAPRLANPNNVANDWGRFINYYRAAFGIKRRVGQRHELSFNASFQYRDMVHPIFQILDQNVRTFSSELRYSYTGTRDRFVIGFAPQATFNGERRFANLGGVQGPRTAHFDSRADNYGLYFENQFDVKPEFTLITGGRIDFARRRFSDLLAPSESDVRNYSVFSPRVGFVWRVIENTQVFANFNRSYEPPILTELTSFGAPGFLPLDAQDTWQIEFGTRGDRIDHRLRYEVAFFDSEIRNEVINLNVRPFPGAPFTIPSYRNVRASRHTGLEVSAHAALAKDLFVQGGELEWSTAYTFANFRFTVDPNFEGNYIPGAPRHLIRSEFRYQHPTGFWIAPNVDWSPAGYFIDSPNTTRNSVYAVFNMRAGFDRRHYGFFVEADNLGDGNYSSSTQVDVADGRYYEPSNGRSVFGGMYFRFGRN